LYNEDAGSGVSVERLRQSIERHGHELVRTLEMDDEIEAVDDDGPEVVAAAGGDGTIAAAARMLAGRGIPLAILPLGTANNIARSVGSHGSLDELIARWSSAFRRPLDLGIVQGPWGERRFVEAVGVGLLPEGIDAMQSDHGVNHGPTNARVEQAAEEYLRVLSRLTPQRWSVDVDGVRTTGDFLLIEVLNIGSIGPNLMLSGDANPSDGAFSVVMVGEEHRNALYRYLRDRFEGRDHPGSFAAQMGREVTLLGKADLHVDDELLTSEGSVSMRIEPAALEILL
jgi:diacylglycerol kinase family enzyme